MNFIIENDEFFKHFLTSETKGKNLIENISVVDQIKKLSDGINVLNTELQKQINLKHKDLLSQASCSSTLETELADIQNHVQSLHSGAEKIKRSITEPYKILESDIHILQRLHSACHILRYVALMQQWLRELDKTSDQIVQAKIIHNLTELVQDPLMSDVEIISANIRQIHLKRQQLSKLAKSQLKQAVISENKSQIMIYIQILANLQILNHEIDELIGGMITEISTSFKTILTQAEEKSNNSLAKNRGRPGPGGANISTTTVTISKDKLWAALDGLFADKIYQQCKQIKLLESLLLDLTNSTNYESFSTTFWHKAIETAVMEMKNSSPIFQSIFEEDYPCILKLYSELTRKLNAKEFLSKQNMMVAWENVYLSKSLSKFLDKLTEMFAESNTCPSQEDIDSLIRIISNELSVALIDEALSNAIAKNVAKAVKSFALRAENIVVTSAETAHTIGVTNASQQFNIQLANTILYFKLQLNRMLTNMSSTLSKNTIQTIETSLKNIDQVITTIISPLVDSINSAIETIILTIHAEPDWNRLQVPPAKKSTMHCSPYMRELIEYIARAYNVHLSPFNSSEALSSCCAKIAIRCIDLFVRHTSLVRPITQGGRLRLQVDYREIEQALCVIYPQLQSLGTPYRLLKTMGTLIVLPPGEVVQSQLVGSSVPHSTVLLMLFSHASSDLQSPHQTTNWSVEKLSKWFDAHVDEKNRMELISGSLQNYLAKVRKNNVTVYDPVYVLMASLINNE